MPLDDVSQVKNRIIEITHLKTKLKIVFARDDLAVIMVALWNRADHYFFILFAVSFFLSFLFPRLISAVGDWMSTILPHMVWP